MKEKKTRKWEDKYNEFKEGKMSEKIEELRKKVEDKSATKEEYSEFKKMEKIEASISKVTNVLELRGKLQEDITLVKQEIERHQAVMKADAESIKIEKDFLDIQENIERVKKELKNKDLDEEAKKDLQERLEKYNAERDENNDAYVKNQEDSLNNKDPKSTKMGLNFMSMEDLKKKSFELGTKVSKCNMVAKNLMEGRDWDSIEVSLDNWQDRKYVSKNKLIDHARGNNLKDNSKVASNLTPKAKEKEEQGLAEVSEFEQKHPRLAKIGNWFKDRGTNIKNFFVKNEKVGQEDEKVEQEDEKVEDNEFKKYLREVAEKGMDQVEKENKEKMMQNAREKLEQARQEAHSRETENFGKDYADKSYTPDDER